jgi:hypothetical protein
LGSSFVQEQIVQGSATPGIRVPGKITSTRIRSDEIFERRARHTPRKDTNVNAVSSLGKGNPEWRPHGNAPATTEVSPDGVGQLSREWLPGREQLPLLQPPLEPLNEIPLRFIVEARKPSGVLVEFLLLRIVELIVPLIRVKDVWRDERRQLRQRVEEIITTHPPIELAIDLVEVDRREIVNQALGKGEDSLPTTRPLR